METVTNTDTSVGERVREERMARGLSLRDFMVRMCMLLPPSLWVSDETLRKIESGVMPARGMNPITLAAIAVVLDLPLSQLDESAAQELGQVAALLARSRCFVAVCPAA